MYAILYVRYSICTLFYMYAILYVRYSILGLTAHCSFTESVHQSQGTSRGSLSVCARMSVSASASMCAPVCASVSASADPVPTAPAPLYVLVLVLALALLRRAMLSSLYGCCERSRYTCRALCTPSSLR
ncbi:hypothetical protein B484DRAFT_293441 [Ochromonadaceae sp. CCMP2298]|nr:hypothetical protein B484DRAFT_293441 [Ochromonadaceae sp. CCMP2298]